MEHVRELQSTKKTFVRISILWTFLFFVTASTSWSMFGLSYVIGIPFVFYFPGYLTLLLVRIEHLELATRTVLAVGISILWLFLVGLMGNWLLPFIGVDRPLDTIPVLLEVTVLVAVLLYAVTRNFTPQFISVPRYLVASTLSEVFLLCIPLGFVVLSIVGPLRLNNDAGNGFVMTLLLSMSLFSVYVFRNASKFSSFVLPAIVYLLSLSLLLMTSLRGWFISGHDIQREFFVFQLAKGAGVWSHAAYVDAYNACLSITILPTMVSNLLHVGDLYIYKVVFQALFALAAVIVFLISRKWLQPHTAFLAAVFFISFPTFFQDMPFLIRQEVAFLFFGLMLLVLLEEKVTLSIRQLLFMVMGVGVILSHYATTYTVLFILGLVSVSTILMRSIQRSGFFSHKKWFASVAQASSIRVAPQRKVTLAMVAVLFLLSALWTSVLTDTGGHVKEVGRNVWSAIQGGFGGNSHSPDVFVLFTFGRGEVERSMSEYITTVVQEERAESPELYYATSTYSAYLFTELEEEEMPFTSLGALALFGKVTLGDLVTSFGKVLAKVMQVAVPLGMLYVLFRKSWARPIDAEFYLFAMYSVVFIMLCVVVPLLSREYGVFRAMQQAMFVLAPCMVVGVLLISRSLARVVEWWVSLILKFKKRTVDDGYVLTIAGLITALFFLYATGFVTQLVGGNIPAVHLNNRGNDFDHYIVVPDEAVAIQWLHERIEGDRLRTGEEPLIHADRFGRKKLEAVLGSTISGDLFPGSIQKDAYVFVGPAVLHGGVAVLMFEGDLVRYAYPIEFLEEHKERVFSNASVRIYK